MSNKTKVVLFDGVLEPRGKEKSGRTGIGSAQDPALVARYMDDRIVKKLLARVLSGDFQKKQGKNR